MSLPEETSSIGDRTAQQEEEVEVNENGGATGSSDPKPQEPSMVSKRLTRGSIEEERKDALNLEERLKEEFGVVTKLYRECQEKVKGMTCLKTGANILEMNEYFKHARNEAQKVWSVMEKVIGQSQNDNDFVMRERGFLQNMGCASLEEVETAVAMDREKVQEFREILETVKDLEGVVGINELLRKISDERDEFQREKAGWENVREELGRLNAIADLKENERLMDRWTSLNNELQDLTTQMEALRMEKAKKEEDCEKLSMEQAQKIVLLEETLDRARAEIVSLGDRNLGKQEEKKAEAQRELEEMRRQRLALQEMRETQRSGRISSPLQSSTESLRTREQPSYEISRTGGPMGSGVGRNGGGNEFGGGDWRRLENEALASPSQSSSTMATALARPSQPSQIGLTLASPSQPSQPSATLASPSQPSGSEEKVIGKSVGMLANRLPPLAKYAGLKEDWEDFETGFLIRFGAMDKTVAMSLLKNNLIGQAKETLRAVPEDVKSSGIESVLEWLRKKLSHETPFEELEWEKKLRTQTVNGKTVGVVCEELEKYTSKMYIGEEEKKETARRKQLMILYEGRHVEQMRLLSLWSEDASYEKMKTSLVELEYLRKTEKDLRGVGRYGSAETCKRCGGFGHKEAQCTSKVGQGGSNGAGGGYNRGYSGQGTGGGYRSTTQGGRGGFSQNRGGQGWQGGQSGNKGWQGGQQSSTGGGYKWQGGQSNQYSGQRPQSSASNGATTSATVHGSGKGTGANAVSIGAGRGSPRCSVVRSRGMPIVDKVVKETRSDEKESIKEDDEYFFIKKRERVKGLIGGVLVEALLDTGADVSVISRNVVDKMKGAMVEKGDTVEVMDAQGRKMDIIGRILLEVDLEVGTKATVGFYVVNNSLSTVIIGGMGLELIGVELKEVKYNEVEEVKGGGTEMNGGEAIVLRDCEVDPGTLGQVWVTGNEKETVMLECEDDTVVQGVACRERIVSIPVFNDTDKVMQFTKHQSIGKWRVVDRGRVNEVSSGDWRGMSSGIDNQVEWSGIREKLVKNRGEEMNSPLEEVLKGCSEAFAKGDEDIGRLKDWDCTVDVMEGKPVRQKPRPIPFAIREKLRALVDRMMRQGVVKKSQSPWSSPIVVVKKKDGSLRLCIDYRKVNQMIRLDAQPLPHLESTIQSLSGKKFFSTIDLQSGFWQVGLAEGSREVTAFSLLGEHFEFQVLPFGLNVSPCQFQRAMIELLKEEMEREGTDQKVFCYIDDVLIATETEEEHMRLIEWVLKRMIERGVKVNPNKCRFMTKQVEYLGHFVSDKGVAMDERKVAAVREHPRPKNSSEVRSFVGLVSYYRRFVKGFAKIAEALHALTANGVEWMWGSKEEKAFNDLKRAITEAPVLIQPDCEAAIVGDRPFLVTTDASGHGIGGVISQANKEGVEQPIAFYSRQLRGPEKNYSIIDLEALAIFEAVRKWKYIIFGTRVIVRTDHAPLLSMFKRQNVCPRILRWATEMREYNLEIVHVKGKDNVVADDLSRFPLPPREGESQEPVTIGEDIVINALTRMQLREQKQRENNERADREIQEGLSRWREIQEADDWAKEMIKKKEEDEAMGKDGSEMMRIPDSTRKYSMADVEVHEGVLYILDRDHERRLYVPMSERERLIKEMHESVLVGHPGVKKMIKILQKEYVWGSFEKDVARVLRGCNLCLLRKPRKRFIPELHPTEVRAPLELVAIDLIDMGKGVLGNRYILTVIDLFTRYAGAYPLKDKKASTVARVFMHSWVLAGSRVPKALLSDNGGEFINEVMEEINKMWKIERHCTLPYHSRANGGVERMNRTINETLRRLVGRTDEWEEALPYALYCYNSLPHSATGESPSFLFYGRDERLPTGESWKVNEKYVVDMDDYKSKMMLLMKRTQEEVNERLKGERERMKASYDRRRENNQLNEPLVGDRVYAYKEKGDEKNPKLRIKWEGPYRVIERMSTTAKLVSIENGDEKTVQLDKLRKVPSVEKISVESVNEYSDCRHVVDRGSQLHWESPCPECLQKPRPFKEIWSECPAEFEDVTFSTLKQYAVLRTLIESYGYGKGKLTPLKATRLMEEGDLEEEKKMSQACVEETVGQTCVHSTRCLKGAGRDWRFFTKDINPAYDVAYRKGLGEDVELSMGYGGIIHCPGVEISGIGGDTARWKWEEKPASEWRDVLMEWQALDPRKCLKKLLVFWPRGLSLERMEEMKKIIEDCTARSCWMTTVVREPCGKETEEHYDDFLMKWATEKLETGWMRVIAMDSGATSDGTPISALHLKYPWIRRDHWEFMVEAWAKGMKWDPKKAQSDLPKKGFDVEDRGSDKPNVKAVARKETTLKRKTCNYCHKPGHFENNCFKKMYDQKEPDGRGRPSSSKGGDVKEKGPSFPKKPRYH